MFRYEQTQRRWSGAPRVVLEGVFDEIKAGGIHLSLPKFELSHHTSLVPALKELGLTSLFEGADFSGIVAGGGDLQIAHVEHEVFVKMNEEGTEAAAATGASFYASHGPTITIDRPFVLVLRDRPTGTVLFLGRVLDPGTAQ